MSGILTGVIHWHIGIKMITFSHIYLCYIDNNGDYIDDVFHYKPGCAGELSRNYNNIVIILTFFSTKNIQEAQDRGRLFVAGLNILIGEKFPFSFDMTSALGKSKNNYTSTKARKYTKDELIQALIATGGNKAQAARLLGVAKYTIIRNTKYYNIDGAAIRNTISRDSAIDALKKSNGRVEEAAKLLNLTRKALSNRLSKFELDYRDFRKNGNGHK